MEKRKGKKAIIIGVGVVLLVIIILAIFMFNNEPKEEVVNEGNEEGNEMVYEDYTIHEGHKGSIEKYDPSMTVEGIEPSNNAYYITGKISAKEDKAFTLIRLNLYDKDDKVIGVAIAGLNELKKGEEYDFRALGDIEESKLGEIEYYKIESIKLG